MLTHFLSPILKATQRKVEQLGPGHIGADSRKYMLIYVKEHKAFRTMPDMYQIFGKCYIKNIFKTLDYEFNTHKSKK